MDDAYLMSLTQPFGDLFDERDRARHRQTLVR